MVKKKKKKNLPVMWEIWVQSLGQEDPLEKGMLPTPVFMPGESHGQRSLAGYRPWGCKESDITEQLTLSLFFVALFQWVKKELKALSMLLHVNLVYFIWLPHNIPLYAYNIIVLKFFGKGHAECFLLCYYKKKKMLPWKTAYISLLGSMWELF